MTRFLSFVILLLHVLTDVRRRVALATTAAIVTVFAILAVISTVATGAGAAPRSEPQLVPATHIAQPEPRVAAELPFTSRQQLRLPVLRAAVDPTSTSPAPRQLSTANPPQPSDSATASQNMSSTTSTPSGATSVASAQAQL
ncbi:MAG: hypothetical protein ACREBW_03640, partial [Candidatus Micrarchaeaceae archaeon]